MPIQTKTGARIKRARNQLGLSLSQLAGRIGVKRKTLENWENDQSQPRADKLVKLAGILQVPLMWLLTGDAPEGANHDPAIPEAAEIAQKLDQAVAMQQDLAALLNAVSADFVRLRRDLEDAQELVA